jgi:uncharacterized UBP type Zn finger protein
MDPLGRLLGIGSCEHVEAIGDPSGPRAAMCEECGRRSPLRTCLTCGHVGCCDSAHGHARRHAELCGHPVIRAQRQGWTYCYEHRAYL